MKKFLLVIIFIVCFGFFLNSSVLAEGKLENAVIRLGEISTNKNPEEILVVFKTNSLVSENGIRLQVDNAWNISNSNSNYVVKTTDLPSGVLPVPNIGASVNVSGQEINLSCGDLQPNQNYGFFINGSFTTNPDVGNNYYWWLSTMVNNTIDRTAQINIPIVLSDQITITGKVPAYANDFQLNLTNNQVTDLKIGDEVIYTINYGSYLASSTKPLRISAEWSRGTINGSMVPSVDILDYVVGSGSTTVGGISPIIDIANRKIIWMIPSFPSNTINNTVSFKLKINDSYTGASVVNFNVDAYLEAANVITISSKSSNYLKPVTNLTPTSVATSNSSTSTETQTPTPVSVLIIKQPLRFENINVVGLSSSGFKIKVLTNQNPTQVKLKYGLSLSNLNKSVTSVNGFKN